MNQQVKEALQKAIGRVRSVDPSYFPVYPGGDKQAIADLAVIAQAYLAEHPADDDDPLDDDWLNSVMHQDGESEDEYWWINSVKRVRFDLQIRNICNEYACVLALPDEGPHVEMPDLKTRGDVRRLCRALGIELKGTP